MKKIVNESLHDYLNESTYNFSVSEQLELDKYAQDINRNVDKFIKNSSGKSNNINENELLHYALLGLSTIVATPAITKLIGMGIQKTSKMFMKYIMRVKKKNPNSAGDVAGEGLKRVADWMHHKLLWPFMKLMRLAGVKDKKTQEKGAMIAHGVMVALLGVSSGMALADAVKYSHTSAAAVEGALTAIKGTETGVHLMTTVETIGVAVTKALGIIK